MSEESDLDEAWALGRDVLENGAPLNLTDETRALLSRTARQVSLDARDADEALRGALTATTLLRDIHQRIGDGSRRLDRARDRVEELQAQGDFHGAQQALRDVLAVEVIPFYRQQAGMLLDESSGLADVLATGRLNASLHDRQQLAVLSLRLQQGHPLEITEELRVLLRRTAPTAAILAAEAEEALKSPEGAEVLMRRILTRFRNGERRFLNSMYRMTRLRDAGNLEEARQQMHDVLAVEPVPQYRRMAEEQLKGLDAPPPES